MTFEQAAGPEVARHVVIFNVAETPTRSLPARELPASRDLPALTRPNRLPREFRALSLYTLYFILYTPTSIPRSLTPPVRFRYMHVNV